MKKCWMDFPPYLIPLQLFDWYESGIAQVKVYWKINDQGYWHGNIFSNLEEKTGIWLILNENETLIEYYFKVTDQVGNIHKTSIYTISTESLISEIPLHILRWIIILAMLGSLQLGFIWHSRRVFRSF